MRKHIEKLHKALAAHHGRLAKIHDAHAERLDDGDIHKAHHRALSEEHATMADAHHEWAKAAGDESSKDFVLELPSAEDLAAYRERHRKAWGADLEPSSVARMPRFDDPRITRVPRDRDSFSPLRKDVEAAEAIKALDPELRRLVE